MRVGLFWVLDCHPDAGQTPARLIHDVLEQTVAAEALGFDVCWYAEHHFTTYGVCPSPAVLLAAASQRTARIRLGVAVSVLPLDNPIRIAEAYALVDVLSRGRLEFGVGSGYLPYEFAGFGVSLEEKRERFDEALAVLRELWRGGPVHYQGRFVQVPGIALNVSPIQADPPPLWIAVGRVQAIRHLAAHGLPVMLIPYVAGLTDGKLAQVIDLFRTAAGPLRVAAAYHVLAAPRAEEARALLYPALDQYLRTRGPGTPDVQTVVEDELVIWGTPEQCLMRIARLQEAGITDLLLIASFGGLPAASVSRTLELLAGRVLPTVRGPVAPAPVS